MAHREEETNYITMRFLYLKLAVLSIVTMKTLSTMLTLHDFIKIWRFFLLYMYIFKKKTILNSQFFSDLKQKIFFKLFFLEVYFLYYNYKFKLN